mgnify:CR=1 FL=1
MMRKKTAPFEHLSDFNCIFEKKIGCNICEHLQESSNNIFTQNIQYIWFISLIFISSVRVILKSSETILYSISI